VNIRSLTTSLFISSIIGSTSSSFAQPLPWLDPHYAKKPDVAIAMNLEGRYAPSVKQEEAPGSAAKPQLKHSQNKNNTTDPALGRRGMCGPTWC
jgi:hypothetical protein